MRMHKSIAPVNVMLEVCKPDETGFLNLDDLKCYIVLYMLSCNVYYLNYHEQGLELLASTAITSKGCPIDHALVIIIVTVGEDTVQPEIFEGSNFRGFCG